MSRPRDRASAAGLLPRMEARPRKDGLITYRYHPLGSKPINLGTDRAAACRQVLDMLGEHNDSGTIGRLWEQYKASPYWGALSPRTHADYADYSAPLLRVFGSMLARDITAPDVARYLRTERGEAPKRANREVSLLGNLIGLAVERGEAAANPCRGGLVKRNPERPRQTTPDADDLRALIAHAQAKGRCRSLITGCATATRVSSRIAMPSCASPLIS